VALRFTWDPSKNEANRRKHRITFETAVRVFSDLRALYEPDRSIDGEQRWQVIGLVDGQIMLLVAHTYTEDEAGETIRIISARRAKRHEERRYDDENG
jgi:uncharacterized DUF497 family protein